VSPSAGAVFLSYASEDSNAARIADALKAANIQVWFDRSALRGGEGDRSARPGDPRLFAVRGIQRPQSKSPLAANCGNAQSAG